jgi:hypothetical protein
VLAVRWYLRLGLSYRDVEELLAERGIDVDHVTVHRWVRRFNPLLADAARSARHRVGDRWFVDETYVKVAGRWVYLYRAVDQFGQAVDVYVSARRDTEAARRFFPARRDQHGCHAGGGHHRPGTHLSPRPRSGGARRLASHRAVCEQPGRGRPRPAEAVVAPDARDQDHDRAAGTHRRSRVCPEPAAATVPVTLVPMRRW